MKMCVSGGKERETELDMEKEAKEGQKVRGGGEEAGDQKAIYIMLMPGLSPLSTLMINIPCQ